jgi:hypothetical protein
LPKSIMRIMDHIHCPENPKLSRKHIENKNKTSFQPPNPESSICFLLGVMTKNT